MANVNLVLGVRKLYTELSHVNYWDLVEKKFTIFLELDNCIEKFFQDFGLLTLLLVPSSIIVLFSLISLGSFTVNSISVVFNIKVGGIAIWLKS